MVDNEQVNVLWHQSGVNAKGEAFVQLFKDGEPIAQMDPEQARDHARAIYEAAEAAEQDAFMFMFLQKEIGVPEIGAMSILVEFRKWREEHGKKGPPSDPKEFTRTEKHKDPPEQKAP